MKNSKLYDLVNGYRSLELRAHVDLDDVINKVTQEVSELVEAILEGDMDEMKKEAGDAIVNILSASAAMGAEIEEKRGGYDGHDISDDFGKLFLRLGKWNQKMQAMRGRYSRDAGCVDCLRDATDSFVSSILDYVEKDRSLSDIVKANTQKFSERVDAYKPKLDLYDFVDSYSDFPKKGIIFKDISPLLKSKEAMRHVCSELALQCQGADIIAALDARGFLFGVEVSKILDKPFVMIRKKGKLPGKVVGMDYSLEYGENSIEIQDSSMKEGQRVALIDDLLATGGTMMAAASLVEKLGGIVNNISCVISLDDRELKGGKSRKNLEKYPIGSVMSY